MKELQQSAVLYNIYIIYNKLVIENLGKGGSGPSNGSIISSNDAASRQNWMARDLA